MKVILMETVRNLGDPGDMVVVKDGYAMNYLIPKKLAMDARDKNSKVIKHKKNILAQKFAKDKKDAQSLAEKISALSCTITRKAGENEKLFGSVSSRDIEEALSLEGVKVDKKNIVIEEPIKKLGIYNVKVEVYKGVESTLKLWVVPEGEEKKEEEKN